MINNRKSQIRLRGKWDKRRLEIVSISVKDIERQNLTASWRSPLKCTGPNYVGKVSVVVK